MQKLRSDSESAAPRSRLLASGDGWIASDVVCCAGPRDQPFEEQHSRTSVAIVLSGTFQYRTSTGRELMTPGSLLLGNAGDCFVCGHEHAAGDRCLSFSYSKEFIETIDAARSRFKTPRVPPLRALSRFIAKSSALLLRPDRAQLEELSLEAFGLSMELENGQQTGPEDLPPSSVARVTRAVRAIDRDPEEPHSLTSLARIAGLSPYHFLRTFEALTRTTPHQYLMRTRLRRAATRLRTEETKVLDIALGCGFGDVANFNRAFRAEFGVSPRAYRRVG